VGDDEDRLEQVEQNDGGREQTDDAGDEASLAREAFLRGVNGTARRFVESVHGRGFW